MREIAMLNSSKRKAVATMALVLALGALGAISPAGSRLRAERWNTEGNALAKAGKSEAAIGAYATATQIDPTLEAAFFNMGAEYYRLRHFDQAASCFRRVLELQPGDVEASQWLTRSQIVIADRPRH